MRRKLVTAQSAASVRLACGRHRTDARKCRPLYEQEAGIAKPLGRPFSARSAERRPGRTESAPVLHPG